MNTYGCTSVQYGPFRTIHLLLLACVLSSCNHANESNSNSVIRNDDSAAILNHQNYADIVGHTFRTYTGKNYRSLFLLDENFRATQTPVNVIALTEDPLERQLEYACQNGGTSVAFVRRTGTRTARVNTHYKNCQWEGSLIDGGVMLDWFDRKYFSSGGTYAFTNFQVTMPNGESVYIDGEITYSVAEDPGGRDTIAWSNNLNSLIRTPSDTQKPIIQEYKNMDSNYYYCIRCLTNLTYTGLSGTLNTRMPQSPKDLLTINTSIDFQNNASNSFKFPVGALSITASDGSEIKLNADNGLADSISVTLSADGIEIQFNEPWSTWESDLLFE